MTSDDHPNVKCYFGHGGLLGLSEGVHTGVPMILMPFYGDQYQNAIAAQARGAALVVNFATLDEETLMHALDEMFNNTCVKNVEFSFQSEMTLRFQKAGEISPIYRVSITVDRSCERVEQM
ncbi:hypothetical protein K0M31_004722 [Melipona bicolor]|uniref:Glucuronosyltransferase n=1 Tax=Melipona bicolor TaxID=60889 RepID=A0AA40FVC9_9HYME|nr:hypothetical protein K0M31_004722 [Melipona bicolor]